MHTEIRKEYPNGVSIALAQPITTGCTCGNWFRSFLSRPPELTPCTAACNELNDDPHRWPLPQQMMGRITPEEWAADMKALWYGPHIMVPPPARGIRG